MREEIKALSYLLSILSVIVYLVVGASIKKNQHWAKVAGVLLSLLSLAAVPVGTIIGAVALYYLLSGWNERAQAVQLFALGGHRGAAA